MIPSVGKVPSRKGQDPGVVSVAWAKEKKKMQEDSEYAAKVRERSRAYHARPEVKARKKQYREEHRQRFRETAKALRAKHIEKYREYTKKWLREYHKTEEWQVYLRAYRQKPRYQWTVLNSSAKQRGLELTIPQEQFYDMITLPCHYCSNAVAEGQFHSLDRVDNDRGYHLDNVVPSCRHCNYMKCAMSCESFLQSVNNVARYRDYVGPHGYAYADSEKHVKFGAYRTRAQAKGLSFEITEIEFGQFIRKSCSYCGQHGPNGLDRKDNTQGYTAVNVAPCCTTCNYMKKDATVEAFLEKCEQVARRYDTILSTVPTRAIDQTKS